MTRVSSLTSSLLCVLLTACGGEPGSDRPAVLDGPVTASVAIETFPDQDALLAAHSDGEFFTLADVSDGDVLAEGTRLTCFGVSAPYPPGPDGEPRGQGCQGFWEQRYVLDQHLVRGADGNVERVRAPKTTVVNHRDESRTIHREVETYPLAAAGEYVDGERHGVWTYWHESGALRAHGRYEHGERVGAWQAWLEDGSVDTSLATGASATEDDAQR